jgi:RNA polymerase sigma-70 factor (family 1)
MKNPGHHHIIGFREGNKEAYAAIFNTFHTPIYYFIKKLVNDADEASDIAAETFIKLWKLRANFDTQQNIKAFLYITARNACLDYLRSTQRQTIKQQEYIYVAGQEQEIITSIHEDIKAEVYQQILEEVEKLPTQCRKIFKMAYLQNMKNAEIAEALGLTSQTVKNQKVRAIKLLRVNLSNIDFALLMILIMQR